MDKLKNYDLTYFRDNKNEGLLHKGNRLLLVSAITAAYKYVVPLFYFIFLPLVPTLFVFWVVSITPVPTAH